MSTGPASGTNRATKGRWLTQLFIVWNLFALTVWVAKPGEGPLFGIVNTYMLFTGLCQNFRVFSPDVNTSCADIVADVKLTDGSTVTWQYPQNASMSIFEKPFKERYREFETSMLAPGNRSILKNAALKVAREVQAKSPNNPPVEVVLKVVWHEVALPNATQPARSGISEFYRAGISTE